MGAVGAVEGAGVVVVRLAGHRPGEKRKGIIL